MLLTWTQRGVIGLAILAGAVAAGWFAGGITAGSLFETTIALGSIRPMTGGLLWFLTLGVLSIAGIAVGAIATRLTGCFVLSAAAAGAGVAGGPIDSYLAASGGAAAYGPVLLEVILLSALFAGTWAGLEHIGRRTGRPCSRAEVFEHHGGAHGSPAGRDVRGPAVKIALLAVIGVLLIAALLGGAVAWHLAGTLALGLLGLAPGVAGMTWLLGRTIPGGIGRADRTEKADPDTPGSDMVRTAAVMVIGGVLAVLLLRTVETGQMIGGLILAFGAAAVAGDVLLPGRPRLVLLLAPLALGFGAYLWVWVNPPAGASLWAAFMAPEPGAFPVLAAVPPVFYASAGVAGVAGGLGLRAAVYAQQAEESRAAAEADWRADPHAPADVAHD